MSVSEKNGATTLKRTMNPKNRGNFVELKEIDIEKLTPREQVFLRVINSLEEQLDQVDKK
jgi:hypothetical protein